MIFENIRKFRMQRGLSQQELAEAIEIDRACLSLLENGKRRVQADDLPILAKALNCEIMHFFEENELNIQKFGWNNFTPESKLIDEKNYLIRQKSKRDGWLVPHLAYWDEEMKRFWLLHCCIGVCPTVDQYCEIPE